MNDINKTGIPDLERERDRLRAENAVLREALGEADMELQSANFRTAHAVLRAVLAKYSKRDGKIWADDPLEKGEDLPVKIIGKYKETP